MIGTIWGLVSGFLSKNALMAGAIAGAIALFLTYDTSRVNAGKEIQKAKQVETDEKAKKQVRSARRRVRSAGSSNRLRKEWCRDC